MRPVVYAHSRGCDPRDDLAVPQFGAYALADGCSYRFRVFPSLTSGRPHALP